MTSKNCIILSLGDRRGRPLQVWSETEKKRSDGVISPEFVGPVYRQSDTLMAGCTRRGSDG